MPIKIVKPPIKSTYISNGRQDKDAFCCPEFFVGNKLRHTFCSLLQFDLPQLLEGTELISGVLNLFLNGNHYLDTERTMGVFQIVSYWDEKRVKWSTQPTTIECPVACIRINDQCQTFLSLNITTLVNDWYTNRAVNFGIMLSIFESESTNSRISFISGNAENSLYWPNLELEFHNVAFQKCSQPLDLTIHTVSSDVIQTTKPLNLLMFDYTYNVINTGNQPAQVYLQVSADGVHWLTQSALYTLLPQECVALVPATICRYSHLCYQSLSWGNDTNLTIIIQGFGV